MRWGWAGLGTLLVALATLSAAGASDDKKPAWLNCIHHILSLIPYKKVPRKDGVVR